MLISTSEISCAIFQLFTWCGDEGGHATLLIGNEAEQHDDEALVDLAAQLE